MTTRPVHALLIALAMALAVAREAVAAPAAPDLCRAVQAQGEAFTVCTVDLRLDWERSPRSRAGASPSR
jgi:uncharacterized protein YigE (DUF2233 family)